MKGTDTLRLDKYDSKTGVSKKPCLIFMFGGGFAAGTRDGKNYIPFFNKLANEGYVVVSIDYRLGLKKAKEEAKREDSGKKRPSLKEFGAFFQGVIDLAVEDLFDATKYILEQSGNWNIDEKMIISCGSSAGAISVLQGEYAICNNAEIAKRLPSGFRYAGIISFAGAVFSTDGKLKWNRKPSPILLFHGDADMNVPYDNLRIKILGFKTRYGFFGSKFIAKQLNETKSPYYFYDVENAAHEIANTPMKLNINEIKTFIDKQVKEKQNLLIHTKVQNTGLPGKNKKFGLNDFLKANNMTK
jgi:predicted esterase